MEDAYKVGGSQRSSFTEGMEGFRLLEIPFSPLPGHNTTASNAQDARYDDLFISPRDYGSRQAYLRSYTFTRASADQEQEEQAAAAAPEARKISPSLLRLKAAAWAVMACTNRLPRGARVFKEKMAIKTSHCLGTSVRYLRMPQCLMAGA